MFSLGRRATASVVTLVVVVVGLSAAPAVESRLRGDLYGRPADAGPEPLGSPPAGDTTGPHEFVRVVDGGPVRYDPCAPIHLVVNSRTAIDGADRMLAESIASIEGATGLVLVVDGPTGEEPSSSRGTSPGARGPVLVAWSDPEEVEDLEGDVAGIAGSVSSRGSGWFDTGSVVLDGPQLGEIRQGRDGYNAARGVVLHELGHLVGLDHVDAEDELMQPEGRPGVTDWGPGDREGLAALGGGECREY